MVQEQLEQTTVEIDGLIYDAETGECLGAVSPEFHVTDQASAEWVMHKAFDLDADIVAIGARLKALSENLGKMKADKERQRSGLLYRFGPELEKFARENLPKGKKTWVCPYGSVAFRATQGGIKVLDPALALEVAQTEGMQNAIKTTESFLVSQLTEAQKGLIESKFGSHDPRWSRAFQKTEPGESSTVKTGIA